MSDETAHIPGGNGPAMKAANGEPIEVGQRWACRKGARDHAACVDVVRVGSSRPPRVRVRFTDDEYEGREEWVPPGRLKVLWEHVDVWQANEARWAAVRDVSADMRDTPEEDAAGWVFDTLPDWNYANRLWGGNSGILVVTDVDGLVADLGIDRAMLADDPVGFRNGDGSLVLPWRVTQPVVQALARKYADRLLPEMGKEESERDTQCRWGYMAGSTYISAEICREVEEKYQPMRQLIRDWCGVGAQERQDELHALRKEVDRLARLIERAINELDQAGQAHTARNLERDLGVPLEVLRQANRATQ
ncbi:hypothetical protein [Amycolatopsis sp. NPDC050768]|uniref:hypothetical protein n=1 Tax=Amycolatopsis sp. NPDC050768 TaxID=3154839 RepID=UPI0033C4F18F